MSTPDHQAIGKPVALAAPATIDEFVKKLHNHVDSFEAHLEQGRDGTLQRPVKDWHDRFESFRRDVGFVAKDIADPQSTAAKLDAVRSASSALSALMASLSPKVREALPKDVVEKIEAANAALRPTHRDNAQERQGH